MIRINSRLTFFHKRIFPLIPIGILILITLLMLPEIPKIWSENKFENLLIFIPHVLYFLIMPFYYNTLIFPLMDKVYEGEDHLVVRLGQIEEKIYFKDILDIKFNLRSFREVYTIQIELKESKFGTTIRFIPKFWVSFRPETPPVIFNHLVTKIQKF